MNLLRALSSQTESDEQKESDGHDVSQDELMDFEQELLDMDDIMTEDNTPPLIVPPAEIRVNSDYQVDRVSDVVVLKPTRISSPEWRTSWTYYSNRNHLTAWQQKHQQQVRILKYVTIARRRVTLLKSAKIELSLKTVEGTSIRMTDVQISSLLVQNVT